MTVSDRAIQTHDLAKRFGPTAVLTNIDLDVERGAVRALLGSNGAGKTTLIRILSTLLPADSGSATVNGFDVGLNPEDVRRSISLTGQFSAVDEVLTGRENLTMMAKLRHVAAPVETVDRMLDKFGMAEAADRRAVAYSGGMRRRIDLATSVIGSPSVLFLDEPTTGLDPEGRMEVWRQ